MTDRNDKRGHLESQCLNRRDANLIITLFGIGEINAIERRISLGNRTVLQFLQIYLYALKEETNVDVVFNLKLTALLPQDGRREGIECIIGFARSRG